MMQQAVHPAIGRFSGHDILSKAFAILDDV